ncbi:MAG: nucleotidyltransferase domain-containing protein [Bacillota bacterium]
MQRWRIALDVFINEFPHTSELAGILVCGSFITGNPSNHSDIDVHLVLKEGEEWRERGNKIVEGYLIEYFCNPPAQIRKYFEDDYTTMSTHAAVQFATGEILLDTKGTVKTLKEEAGDWLNKPFERIGVTELELTKYAIWDNLDNLQDIYEKKAEDIRFVYHNSLNILFDQYCHFLSVEQIPYYQKKSYLSEKNYLKKYLKNPFPDEVFSEMFLKALQMTKENQMVEMYEKLSNYVLSEMGGFSINGWKMKSSIEK